VARRATAVPTVLRAAGGKARRGAALVAAAATDDLRAAIMSGEWPENFSHLSYDDLRAYLESQITTAGEVRVRPLNCPSLPPLPCSAGFDVIGVGRQMSPEARLMDVMSRPVQVATPGQRLAEVDAFFAAQQFSGLPVVDEDEGRCVGVVSKKDTAKAPNGVSSRPTAHDVCGLFAWIGLIQITCSLDADGLNCW
jgi:CBS domain-containing protein